MKKVLYVLGFVGFVVVLVLAFVFVNRPLNITSTNKINDSGESNVMTLEEIGLPYLSDDEYDEKVVNYQGKVLIDYYTDWCYYCTVFSPTIEDVSKEIKDVQFYRVNAEKEKNIATQNRIMFYPTIILYENGVETDRYSGVLSKADLIKFIQGELFEEEN